MTIGKRILLLSALLLALNALLGFSGLIYVGKLGDTAKDFAANTVPSVYIAGRINTGAKAILLRVHRHLSSRSPDQMAKFESYLNDRERSVREEMRSYEKLKLGDRERGLLSGIAADLDQVLSAWHKVSAMSRAGNKQEAVDLFDREGIAAAEDLDTKAKELVALNKAESDGLGKVAAARALAARTWIVGILAFSLLLGIVLAAYIVRGLNRALWLTVEEVTAGTRELLSASEQISTTSQALADGANRQAASLEETSAAGTQISSTAARNVAHTKSAVELSQQSQQRSADAEAALDHMVKAMAEIDASSNKISQIIRTIDEIAFQTNILALNASVEAARAGEAGMGFSVVADEVRSLALRSAQAARDTSALIEESIARSRGGKERVHEVAASINGVAELTGKLQELILEVSLGSEEQAKGIGQVSQAMVQMESTTQQTAAHSEESAAAAEELNSQATLLQGTVDRLVALAGTRRG